MRFPFHLVIRFEATINKQDACCTFMKISPARLAAYDILWRVQTEDAYASNLLASLRYEALSSVDHALAQELTLGVLRWQLQLDWLIEHFARRKLKKLDAEVVIALRLGIYQLNFLSRIPPHAAINESVNLVKLHKKFSAAPMVNGVLRSVQRAGKEGIAALLDAIKTPLEKLSIVASHPQWLLQKWADRFGFEEAQALALANNHSPQIAFRFHQRVQAEATTREWFDAHQIKLRNSTLAPNAAVIAQGSLSALSEPMQKNWIYLQDEASQFVAHALTANLKSQISNLKLLDVCAAPGSKTSLLASLLPDDAVIVAGDLHLHRLQTMRELAARANVTNLNLVQLDASKSLPFATEAMFDAVLLDAPCSGLGTLQRHPEIKWRVTQTKIQELAELQKTLLVNAASQVRAGGTLTYSVCSTEVEEGEDVISWFRAQQPAFQDVTKERLEALGIDFADRLTPIVGARTFTHEHKCESFFVCVLQRE